MQATQDIAQRDEYRDEPLASLSRVRVFGPGSDGVRPIYCYPHVDNVAAAYTVFEDATIRIGVFGRTYVLHDKISSEDITFAFKEFFEGPLRVDSLKGSFLVEAWRVRNRPFQYVCFFLYPHERRIHVWFVYGNGERMQGLDLSEDAARTFLVHRAPENLMFAYRLALLTESRSPSGDEVANLSADAQPPGVEAGGLSFGHFLGAGNVDDFGENAAFAALLENARPPSCKVGPVDELLRRHANELRSAARAAYGLVDRRTRLVDSLTSPGGFSRNIATSAGNLEILVHGFRSGMSGVDLLRAAAATQLPRAQLPASRVAMIQSAMERVSIRRMNDDEHAEAMNRDSRVVTIEIRTKPVVSVQFAVPQFLADVELFRSRFGGSGSDPFGPLPRVYILLVQLADMIITASERLLAAVWREIRSLPDTLRLYATWGDGSLVPGIATYGRRLGSNNLLVADPYFYGSDSYMRWKRLVVSDGLKWTDRSAKAIWRGSTTGAKFSSDNLMANPRIRMAFLCRGHSNLFDAKIVAVPQVDPQDVQAVTRILENSDLLTKMIVPSEYRKYQFSIDIDGNANAWGFFEKMALGLCILKVESPFEQWFYSDLRPWVHYVPVSPQMHDLVPIMQELQANPRVAEEIARAAAAFALERDVTSEAVAFCRAIARGIVAGAVQVE